MYRLLQARFASDEAQSHTHRMPGVQSQERRAEPFAIPEKVCPECGGTGHVTPIGREQVLKRIRLEARG